MFTIPVNTFLKSPADDLLKNINTSMEVIYIYCGLFVLILVVFVSIVRRSRFQILHLEP